MRTQYKTHKSYKDYTPAHTYYEFENQRPSA